jgi:hypothetical protein
LPTADWQACSRPRLPTFLGAATLSKPVHAIETALYLHNDLSGTPQAATDIGGNLLWKETYRPYGERAGNAAASKLIFLEDYFRPFFLNPIFDSTW